MSGWWQIVYILSWLLALLGPALWHIIYCLDSRPGSNKYGVNPKKHQPSAAGNQNFNWLWGLVGLGCVVYFVGINIYHKEISSQLEQEASEMAAAYSDYKSAQICENGPESVRDKTLADRYYRSAAERYLKYAAKGNSEAMYMLSLCYARGKGVEANQTEALRLLMEAAEQGYAPAQFDLAKCYASGFLVIRNDAEGLKWLRKAAEQGYEPAQRILNSSVNQ